MQILLVFIQLRFHLLYSLSVLVHNYILVPWEIDLIPALPSNNFINQ